MPTYATQTDFEAYVEGWVTDDADALDRLLERAELDVDRILGPGQRRDDTGLLYDPANLTAAQAASLSRATCAQAEYRFRMGEEFFSAAQYEDVTGPDFSTKGRLPYYAPKVREELANAGLRQMTARARA